MAPCVDTWSFIGDGVFVTASTDVRVQSVIAVDQNNSVPDTPTYSAAGYYWQVMTPDSSVHKLADTGNSIFRAIDGTGGMFNAATYVLTSKDCTRCIYSPGTPGLDGVPTASVLQYVEDTNGNRITLNYQTTSEGLYLMGWTDTLGRTISAPPLGALYADPSYAPVKWTRSSAYCACPGTNGDPNPIIWMPPGGTKPFLFCYSNVHIQSTFFWVGPAKGIPDVPPTGDKNKDTRYEVDDDLGFLSQVVLPTGDQWQFQYTPLTGYDGVHNYGELTQITMPTGGTIGYAWNESFLAGCTGTYTANQVRSAVVNRWTDNKQGLGPQLWTYGIPQGIVPTELNSYPGLTQSLAADVDPFGNTTIHTLTYLLGCSAPETQAATYDSQENLLKTVATTYQVLPNMDVISTNMGHDAQVA